MQTGDLPQIDAAISTTKAGDGAYAIAVKGELDLYSTPQLTAELEAIAHDGPDVVLDLSEVSFLDSTALGAILVATRRVGEAGGTLVLVSAQQTTTRLLSLVGIDRVVRIFEDRDRAVEHLAAAAVLRKLEQS